MFVNANILLNQIKQHEEKKRDWLKINPTSLRKVGECKFGDIFIMIDNKFVKTERIRWENVKLSSGAPEPSSRKYSKVSVQFRASYDPIGIVLEKISKKFIEVINKHIASKELILKRGQSVTTPVQYEISSTEEKIEDPIIRVNIKFNENGEPGFLLHKVTYDKKTETVEREKLSCNINNCHNVIKSGMLSSGLIYLSWYGHPRGYSIGFSIKELYLRQKAVKIVSSNVEIFTKDELMNIADVNDEDDEPAKHNEPAVVVSDDEDNNLENQLNALTILTE